MSRSPDVDLVLREYLADDGAFAPDYVLDVVADRIARQPQRRTWRLRGRPFMNLYVKAAAGLAAAILVAVIGYNLLPRQPSVGGQPTPSPTIPASPSPSPVGIRDVPTTGGYLEPGQWRTNITTGSRSLSVIADIPEGWVAFEDGGGFENQLATNSPPSGLAILFEMPTHGVFSDPCHWDLAGTGTWDQDGDVATGSSVAELVAALRANTSFTSSAPSPVTFGPYSGQQLELRFPATLDQLTCDKQTGETEGKYRVMPDTIYSQGQANIWRMSIVDVAGTRRVVTIEYFPGTAPAKLAQAQAIVDSFEFTPGP